MSAWSSEEAAKAWHEMSARRAAAFATVTSLMLDLARLAPGAQVLDIAAGTGEQSLEAAARVGEHGSVLATDISAPMLEICAESARSAGLANVRTQVLAGEHARKLGSARFDALISRFGLMFVPDLDAALAGFFEIVRPKGRLAAAVWDEEEANPYIGAPLAALRELGRTRDEDELAAAHSLGGDRLPEALRKAGFRDVEAHSVEVVRRFASAAEAVATIRKSAAAVGAVGRLEPELQEVVWTAVERRYAAFDTGQGCEMRGLAIVAAGTRP